MTSYTFIIHGNQENDQGNPIPYLRMTQGSKWSKQAKRYLSWKEYVRKTFQKVHNISFIDKPFNAPKARLTVHCSFRGENHADLDNIAKGLLDSLFIQDKHVDVTTTHSCGNAKGSCVVTVDIY